MTLQQYLDSRRDTPFKWGEHDCAMFYACGSDATRGTNYASHVRALGVQSAIAYRKLTRRNPLRQMVCEVMGEPITGAPQDGDAALVAGVMIGIVVLPVILVAHSVGFVPVPLAEGTAFWRPA